MRQMNVILADIVTAVGGTASPSDTRNSLLTKWRDVLSPPVIQRVFALFDPVQNGKGEMQTAVVIPNNFRVSALCVLTTSATTVSLFGQDSSTLNYLKVLSTGFASLSIDGSVVTSTVLATKDGQIRTYGVELSGNDFLFQENGVTIDTVTDAVAAAKTLTLDAVAQSNGADFFDGIYADPKVADLVNASNSESWKIDKATGNTEQSSSGNNILTLEFVPDADRGLLRLNTSVTPERWVGVVDKMPQPIDLNAAWLMGTAATIVNQNTFITTFPSGVRINLGITGNHEVNYDITSANSSWQLRDSITGSPSDPLILQAASASESGSVDYDFTNGGVYVRKFGTVNVNTTINAISVHAFIEVAP